MSRNLVRRYRNVFLVGLPGVGKTTFGQTYAAHTYRSFFDLDTVIEREHGKTVAEIFQSEGEEAFRQLEHHALFKLMKRQNIVLSLGGGALSSEETLLAAAEHGLIVHLKEDLKILAARVWEDRATRPLLAGAQNVSEALEILETLWTKRQIFYERAHIELDSRYSSFDSLKLELSTFERRAFRRTYQHDLEILGEKLPGAPEIQVHQKPRYVLREKPYLAAGTEGSLKSRMRSVQKNKKAAGRAKRSRASETESGHDPLRMVQNAHKERIRQDAAPQAAGFKPPRARPGTVVGRQHPGQPSQNRQTRPPLAPLRSESRLESQPESSAVSLPTVQSPHEVKGNPSGNQATRERDSRARSESQPPLTPEREREGGARRQGRKRFSPGHRRPNSDV